jgi:hypothetical protein
MGIGFQVVYSPIQPIWVPVDTTDTLSQGCLVYYGKRTNANTGGVKVLAAASGNCNLTNGTSPWGVVIGDNNLSPVYTTLSTALVKMQTITGVDTAVAQLARDWRLAEGGMYGKGDPQALVQVVRITPDTVLKGFFRGSATVGTTNITETTAASGLSTTGATLTATAGFTGLADNATICYTNGANAGIYRVRTDTGTTITTNTKAFPATPVAGDKVKSVNVRQGYCRMNIDTTYGLWIDNTAALTSDHYQVNVLDINLMTPAGEEYMVFQFAVDNFIVHTVRTTT